jgi:hypothetical protein
MATQIKRMRLWMSLCGGYIDGYRRVIVLLLGLASVDEISPHRKIYIYISWMYPILHLEKKPA